MELLAPPPPRPPPPPPFPNRVCLFSSLLPPVLGVWGKWRRISIMLTTTTIWCSNLQCDSAPFEKQSRLSSRRLNESPNLLPGRFEMRGCCCQLVIRSEGVGILGLDLYCVLQFGSTHKSVHDQLSSKSTDWSHNTPAFAQTI